MTYGGRRVQWNLWWLQAMGSVPLCHSTVQPLEALKRVADHSSPPSNARGAFCWTGGRISVTSNRKRKVSCFEDEVSHHPFSKGLDPE